MQSVYMEKFNFLRNGLSKGSDILSVGKCRTLYDIFTAFIVSSCATTINPLNSFWFCLGSALVLFIPSMISGLWLGALITRQYGGVLDTYSIRYSKYPDLMPSTTNNASSLHYTKSDLSGKKTSAQRSRDSVTRKSTLHSLKSKTELSPSTKSDTVSPSSRESDADLLPSTKSKTISSPYSKGSVTKTFTSSVQNVTKDKDKSKRKK
ncbi:hypothetical protein HELRODRAFT_166697 [Helobdella robusta]|uniref:Uncharacterized protein n=1 Tax=Helobdella robusta TaxID=6412 RepID=T1EYD8_HELRO|nr:hypothetical protein HELRODRAFT_166697 [Helobdella robusta]ESO11682.1 hypothetical protein HELRODRAFT_166697 [Helobdella robusta]